MWVLRVKSDGVRCARFCVSGVSTTATLIDPPPFDPAGLWSSPPHAPGTVIVSPSTTAPLRAPTRQVCSFAPAGERPDRRRRSGGCFPGAGELQRDHRAVV